MSDIVLKISVKNIKTDSKTVKFHCPYCLLLFCQSALSTSTFSALRVQRQLEKSRAYFL